MIPGDVNCSDRGVGSSGSKGAGEGRWRGAQGGGQVLMYSGWWWAGWWWAGSHVFLIMMGWLMIEGRWRASSSQIHNISRLVFRILAETESEDPSSVQLLSDQVSLDILRYFSLFTSFTSSEIFTSSKSNWTPSGFQGDWDDHQCQARGGGKGQYQAMKHDHFKLVESTSLCHFLPSLTDAYYQRSPNPGQHGLHVRHQAGWSTCEAMV